MDERYSVSYLGEDSPEIADVVTACTDVGLTTTPDERADVFAEYYVKEPDAGRTDYADVNRSSAVHDLAAARSGGVTFWFDDAEEATVTVRFEGQRDDWRRPSLSFDFQLLQLDRTSAAVSEDAARSRVETVVSLTGALATVVDPEYAWGEISTRGEFVTEQRPTTRPIHEDVDELGWITVLSPALVEQFGGRDRVLDAPARRVEELETGHVLIVKSDNPNESASRSSGSVDEFLLEGQSVDGGSGDGQPTAYDPFRDLSPGECGADVVLETSAVGGDVSNEDLQVVRCEVGDEGGLWSVDDGTFVRRRLEGLKTPIGDVPAGASAEAERYSLLVPMAIPVEFVRLDSPSDENVVTRLMDLDVDVFRGDLLARFKRVVASGEADVETIEAALTNLQGVDEFDEVDRFVRERFL